MNNIWNKKIQELILSNNQENFKLGLLLLGDNDVELASYWYMSNVQRKHLNLPILDEDVTAKTATPLVKWTYNNAVELSKTSIKGDRAFLKRKYDKYFSSKDKSSSRDESVR